MHNNILKVLTKCCSKEIKKCPVVNAFKMDGRRGQVILVHYSNLGFSAEFEALKIDLFTNQFHKLKNTTKRLNEWMELIENAKRWRKSQIQNNFYFHSLTIFCTPLSLPRPIDVWKPNAVHDWRVKWPSRIRIKNLMMVITRGGGGGGQLEDETLCWDSYSSTLGCLDFSSLLLVGFL